MFCIYAIIINIPEVLFFPFNNGKKGGQAGEENKNQAYGSQGEGIFCEIPFVARVGSIQEGGVPAQWQSTRTRAAGICAV